MKFIENTKIGVKIVAMMAGLGAICLAIAVYGGSRIMSTDASYSDLNDIKAPARMSLARANRSVIQMGYLTAMGIFYDGDTTEGQAARSEYEKVFVTAGVFLDTALKGLPEHAGEIAALRDQMIKIKAHLDPIQELGRQNRDAEAGAAMSAVYQEVSGFSDANRKLVDLSNAETEAESTALSAASARTRWQLIIVAVVGIVAGFGAALSVTTSSITKPLNRLAERMRRLASGELDVEIDGQGRGDEIGLMAKAVQVFKDNGLEARALS